MSRDLRRILVDLTPLLPGGENGGAKPLARSLVRELSALAPHIEFTLLTSALGYAEVADLERPNVRRENVDVAAVGAAEPRGVALSGARLAARAIVNTLVPAPRRMRIKDAVWTGVKRWQRRSVTKTARADLVFSPFTAPFFFDPRIPLLSLVHDLQHVDLPEFFEDERRRDRHTHFQDACRLADRLVCVSDFVRQRVLDVSGLPPGRVQTIHSALVRKLDPDPRANEIAERVLEQLGLRSRRFLLYPANAWPHKNHRGLLEAFRLYCRANPTSELGLVCTGAPSGLADEVVALAAAMLPAGSFAFAGYLPGRDFVALLRTSRGLIFPSLYEGFGLPVLEAMAIGKPVLCSNVTSLPEVAGDAALLFDPRDPAAIAAAITRLESAPELERELVRRGFERTRLLGSAQDMAANYLTAFQDVVHARRSGT